MEVRVLGPIDVVRGGTARALGPQQTALLAALLLAGGRGVPTHRLIELLWDDPAPEGAATTLRSHVLRLRRVLGVGTDVLSVEGSGEAAGYALHLEPEQVDAVRFERLLQEAEQALEAGDARDAASTLRAALDLWRGEALAGVGQRPFAVSEAARLEDLRHRAQFARWQAELQLGRHGQIVYELDSALGERPEDVELRRLLALAYYRSGHREKAIDVCRRGLELAAASGLDSPRLQGLQRDILRAEPGLEWTPPDLASPCNLPPAVAGFSDRTALTEALRDLLCREWTDTTAPVAVLSGKPGIGKTALALHVAHLVRARYPDGQLYVDLFGTQPRPAEAHGVLGLLLAGLGVPASAIPSSLDERCALYRERLAARRILIVLDDAAGERQVRPLLPSRPGSALLVTCRGGLFSLENARHFTLDVLGQDDSVELLTQIAGPEAVRADPEAAERIAALAGGLPLAIRIAGARVAARPHRGLQSLAAQLAEDQRRLDQLAFRDMEVRASFALSYQALDERSRSAFRRLGLLGTPDFATWTAAALLDMPAAEAEEQVETLVEAQLLEVAGDDALGQTRYRFHDLLRLYARERAREEATPGERIAAIARWLDACLHLAQAADGRLGTGSIGQSEAPVLTWLLPGPVLEGLLRDPLRLLEAERAVLQAAISEATAAAPQHGWAIAAALGGLFSMASGYDDWLRAHTQALTSARRAGSRLGEAVILHQLGGLHTIQGRYEGGGDCFRAAGELFREVGEVHGEAAVACGLGVIHRIKGRYRLGLASFQRGLDLYGAVGDERGMVYAQLGIGAIRTEQAELEDAREWLTRALDLSRRAGYAQGEVQALRGLGIALWCLREAAEAESCLWRARAICVERGDRRFEAQAAQWIGHLMMERGDLDEAEVTLAWCLSVFQEFGERFWHAVALYSMGVLHGRRGDRERSTACLEEVLAVWRELQSPFWEAQTLEALARTLEGGAARRAAAEARAIREALAAG